MEAEAKCFSKSALLLPGHDSFDVVPNQKKSKDKSPSQSKDEFKTLT